MGIRCDKIVGYSLDIMEEWESLKDAKKDKLLEMNNSELGYVGYYSKDNMKDKVTIIYDGLDGNYCKLIYVMEINTNGYDEDCVKVNKCINSLLETATVSFSVKQKIKQVYKELFGVDLNRTSRIHAEYITHFH